MPHRYIVCMPTVYRHILDILLTHCITLSIGAALCSLYLKSETVDLQKMCGEEFVVVVSRVSFCFQQPYYVGVTLMNPQSFLYGYRI